MRAWYLAAATVFFTLTIGESARAGAPAGDLAAPAPGSAAATTAATAWNAEQQAVKARVEELFTASKESNGPTKDKARKDLETAIDWETIAKKCLGDAQWKKNAAKRGEFKNLLKEVVLLTAYSRMESFWKGSKYDFTKIDVKGNSADVVTKFVVNNEPFVLEYNFEKRAKTWFLSDISFEDMRYSVNINEQIGAFLKEKSFNDLLKNLKKRRDDLASGKRAPKTDGAL